MGLTHKKSVVISYIVMFSSLAMILTLVRAEVAFPLLPYLKFDFAEIPVMIVFMLEGPIPSLITEVIHWLGLTFSRSSLLGPLMKFLAVAPMIIGFWAGILMFRKTLGKHVERKPLRILISGLAFGIILRVIVCTITNIILFSFIDPNYLIFAERTLKAVGVNISSPSDVWFWTLAFTGLFNALHVPISSILAFVILNAALKRIPNLFGSTWLSQI